MYFAWNMLCIFYWELRAPLLSWQLLNGFHWMIGLVRGVFCASMLSEVEPGSHTYHRGSQVIADLANSRSQEI